MEEHPVLERVYDAICDLFPAHIEADADFHELETDAALSHDPDAVETLREYHDFLRDEMDLDAMHPDDAFIGLSAEEQELIGVKKDLVLTAEKQQSRRQSALDREQRRINRAKKIRKWRMKWRTNREAKKVIRKAGEDAKRKAIAETRPVARSEAQRKRDEYEKRQAQEDARQMGETIGRFYDEERYDDYGGRHDPRWYERDDWYHGGDAERAYQRKYGFTGDEYMAHDLAMLRSMHRDIASSTTTYYDDVQQIEEEEEEQDVGFYH